MNDNFKPDLDQAQRALTLLAKDGLVTFQTFGEGVEKNPRLARILHGTLQQHTDTLAQLNAQGAGIFFMPNQGDQKGRKKENVTGIGALFIDLDGSPLDPVLESGVEPHLTVESSPGRYHAYWRVVDCSLEQFTPLQAALAVKFNSDPKVKDLPRVMRLPGFLHQKNEPFKTLILSESRAQPYALADLMKRLGIDAVPARVSPIALNAYRGTRNLPIRSMMPTNAANDSIPDGSRNATLTSLAGSMQRRGMSPESIGAALKEENQARCIPPLDEDEVCRIVESVGCYEPDESASRPVYSRMDLSRMIEANDDFDELTEVIAKHVTHSELRNSEKELLRKAIANKAKVTLASIKQDAKAQNISAAGGEFDHLETAKKVIHQFGEGNLIHAQSYPWTWDGSVWAHVDERIIKQKIHDVAAEHGLTANVVSSILDMVKTESHNSGFTFDADNSTINCANGELKFTDGEWMLLPHDREHYHTAMLPVAYDPTATAPRFKQFLSEIFKGDADAKDKSKIVLEALGYTLTTGCQLEKFFMLIGSGANGKSVLLFVVAELLGRKYVCAVQPSQFENRFQRGHLQGKLANIITEIAEGAEIADAQLKSLVSGEMTTAEHKHKDPFDFLPYAKHWFGTNHLPHTRDFSDALFRRAIILTFNNKFEGKRRDVHLAAKLKDELPGILNMALEGLQRLHERNAFTECISSIEIARQWRMEADQVAQFVADSCETGSGKRTGSGELYLHYLGWAIGAGVKRTLNRNNFTTRLTRLGFASGRGTGGTRMIEGIRPLPVMR